MQPRAVLNQMKYSTMPTGMRTIFLLDPRLIIYFLSNVCPAGVDAFLC